LVRLDLNKGLFKRMGKWSLATRVLPVALILCILKFVVHYLNFEFISLNPLFSGLLAATVFLLGFLISGVLSDYKESEKLPGELAIALESMTDQITVIQLGGKAKQTGDCLRYIDDLRESILKWLYQETPSGTVMQKVGDLSAFAASLAQDVPPQFVARLLQEQSSLRRTLTRIEAIRETSFVRSAYAIAEIMAALLILGLVFAKIDPFYESLFFLGIISFLLVYLLMLIKDLDNPFEYTRGSSNGPDEVSLAPLVELANRHDATTKSR
jgi:hypothetical protein